MVNASWLVRGIYLPIGALSMLPKQGLETIRHPMVGAQEYRVGRGPCDAKRAKALSILLTAIIHADGDIPVKCWIQNGKSHANVKHNVD